MENQPLRDEDANLHSKPKKFRSTSWKVFLIVSIVAFGAVLVYSEREKRDNREIQERYHGQIQTIEARLREGNCTEASREYAAAKKTREEIAQRGFYYSFDSHAKQAHAIEIAECYAKRRQYKTALSILEREPVNDPDGLLRASVIYENAGEKRKAREARAKAENY